MTIKEFIAKHGITILSAYTGYRPDLTEDDDWAADAHHYKCTLTYKPGKKARRLTVYFSMGSAHTANPTAYDVLTSLQLDAGALGQGFEDWAGDYGYDVDSRKAERTYRACVRSARKLRRFMDNDMHAEFMGAIDE